ncbi:MAG TPA: amidohydrolase family protein [Candidatus Lokiarchaeia archaeon]|nr:amidohydrolase family protein [Candidatus Lokiarchaeia archaeon]
MSQETISSSFGPIFDTHEHFGYFSEYSPANSSLTLVDVINHAYMNVGQPSTDYKTICERLNRYAGSSRFEALRQAIRALHGLDMYPLVPSTLASIDTKIQEESTDPWHPFAILKDRGNVAAIIMDIPVEKRARWDDPSIRYTIRIDDVIFPFTHVKPGIYKTETGLNKIETFAVKQGMALDSLDMFDDAMERYLQALKPSTASIKIGTAYQRSNHFHLEENDDGQVTSIYARIADKQGAISEHEMRCWGDYIVTRLLGFAQVENLPVQVHTGLASMQETSPLELVEIMGAFPGVTFDLFHGGYPFHHCMPGVLDKCSNSRIDLCWLPLLSETATTELLRDIIEMGQSDRVLAFGGDCQSPYGSYGALLVIKDLLATILERFVNSGRLTREDAIAMGNEMLWDTPRAVFRWNNELHA